MSVKISQSWQVEKPAVISESGIVSSQSRVASKVGAKILAQGDNAVDVAIATAFALGEWHWWRLHDCAKTGSELRRGN